MEDNATLQHERAVKNLISTQVLFDGTDVKLCDFGLTTPCRRDASGARLFFPQRAAWKSISRVDAVGASEI